jgi:hypothetical protein
MYHMCLEHGHALPESAEPSLGDVAVLVRDFDRSERDQEGKPLETRPHASRLAAYKGGLHNGIWGFVTRMEVGKIWLAIPVGSRFVMYTFNMRDPRIVGWISPPPLRS